MKLEYEVIAFALKATRNACYVDREGLKRINQACRKNDMNWFKLYRICSVTL